MRNRFPDTILRRIIIVVRLFVSKLLAAKLEPIEVGDDRLVQNSAHERSANSLGNYTVNKVYSFLMVFVDFVREDFILMTFAKIFRIGLVLAHFSCI